MEREKNKHEDLPDFEILLAEKRKKIDELDQIIAEALSERMAVAREIGELKIKSQANLYDARREELLIRRVCQIAVEKGLQPSVAEETMEAVYHVILEKSKAYQKLGLNE